MILSLMRFFVFGMIFMTIGYLLTRYYLASTLREGFEKEWDALPPETRPADRDGWVDTNMRGLTRGIRIRAFLLAYVVPTISVSAIWFAVN